MYNMTVPHMFSMSVYIVIQKVNVCLIHLLQIHYWLFQKKNRKGEGGGGRGLRPYFFLENPLEFFSFHFTSVNSRENKAPPLEIPQNCVRSLGGSKTKNQDSRKFHIIFSWSPLEIPLRF